MGKTCEVCGAPLTRQKRFCSYICMGQWSSKAYKNQVTRTCKYCGNSFETTPSKARKGNKFCSQDCYVSWRSEFSRGKDNPNWRGGDVELVCETCGSTFTVCKAREKKQNARFCSRDCLYEWKSKKQRGSNAPGWKGGRKTKCICKQCGQEFKVYMATIRKGGGIYCSRECQAQWRRENLLGENGYNWRGGTSFEPYSPEFNEQFKEMIRTRDNYSCAICNEFGNHVHHIDYDKQNTVPENCITLCNSCHSKTNGKRKRWIKRLHQIAATREQVTAGRGNGSGHVPEREEQEA